MSQPNILLRSSRTLFGSINWHPAPWMSFLSEIFKMRPLASLLTLFLFLTCAAGVVLGYQWYQGRPQPLTFNAEIERPTIPSANAVKTRPETLWVNFSVDKHSLKAAHLRAEQKDEYDVAIPDSILSIESINVASLSGVSISPAIKGTWKSTTNGLGFTPDKHWPANSTYSLAFNQTLFKPSISLSQETYAFTTAPLRVAVTNTRLHADPNAPSKQRYISTLTFTHPVNIHSLKQNFQLEIYDAPATTGQIKLDYELTAEQGRESQQSRIFYINSSGIEITNTNRYLVATLTPSLQLNHIEDYLRNSNNNSIASDISYSTKLQIPNAQNFFHVESSQVQIVRDEDDNPQQAFLLELSDAVTLESIRDHIEAYVLPDKNPNNQHEQWTSASQISPELERKAELIKLEALPIEYESSRLVSFVFNAPESKQLLIKLKAGVISTGGFKFSKDYRQVAQIPEYPKELSFLGDGSVLDRSGSNKIGLVSRGINKIRVSVGKIREDQLHHLISQTTGDLKTPSFDHWLQPDDIAIISEDTINLRQEVAGSPSYSSIDLGNYLTDEDKKTGLFHVTVFGIDRDGNERIQQQRLVLITNIGFLIKVNNDRSQDVFVQNVDSGEPSGSTKVSVLGRNGLIVWSTKTDKLGHAKIDNLNSFTRDKQPIAILVEKNGDMAYLPMQSHTQELNTSRFDTGGVYIDPNSEDDIRAFLFSDRGIYRPGETVKIGVIARAADLRPTQPFSVGLFITDPRGTNVYEKQHKLTDDGFFETELATLPHSVTGLYNGTLYLAENDGYTHHLGSFQFSVEEFQPDRLKITSSINKEILKTRPDANLTNSSFKGWLRAEDVKFSVALDNLFGTAAQARRVSGSYRLTSKAFRFDSYPEFVFSDVVDNNSAINQSRGGALPNQTTDKLGEATFSPKLDSLFAGSYAITLNAEGFEENGGRSVQTQAIVRFSPRDYLIGFQTKSDLNYLKTKNSETIDFLCINQFVQAQSCENLRLQLVEKNYISTLVKQSNGTYQYQSIEIFTVIDDQPLALSESGYQYTIDTNMPGNFEVRIIDANASQRQSIPFRVVGTSNLSANLEKDSHLDIALNKSEYKSGDWIELQLNSPYTGSGLITIESSSTHAFKWFKTDKKQSIQRIQVPDGLRGNAYVQVSFIRGANSKDIFTAPLSYAISPFNVARSDHQLELSLEVANEIQPGHTLSVKATSDLPGKAIIFAVDEGILQVANYQTPRPLEFFLQKRALQVQTYQMFDLLLPEFDLLKELSATGGGMSKEKQISTAVSKSMNPFSRKVKDPIAFWSGIVDIGPDANEVTFDIPDHFDGTLRVMAVGLHEARFSQAEQSVIIKGPFVVSPNAPLVVAPGDMFTVTVGISNQLEGSGESAMISMIATSSEHLELVGEYKQSLMVPEGDESTVTYQLKATDKLGTAELKFLTSSESATIIGERSVTTSLSVRPATLLTSSITSGRHSKGEMLVPIERKMLADRSHSNFYVSNDPTLIINGLINYLDVYPHECTEQIVSQASPLLAYLEHPNYLGTPAIKREKLETLFLSLRGRQLPNGGFTLWPGGSAAAELPTIHALHMLIDAADEGVELPPYLLDNGISYLHKIAFDLNFMQRETELAAYALYLLTRLGEVTNNGLIQLEEILEATEQGQKSTWKNQLVAAYMASSYTLLKRERDALTLVRQYKFKSARNRINRYDSALYRDAMALYLLAKHFPQELNNDDTTRIEAIIEPILTGNINTLSSSRALLALKAYAQTINYEEASFNVESSNTELSSDATKNWLKIDLQLVEENSTHLRATLARLNRALKITSDSTTYYQMIQSGFDLLAPTKAKSNGLDISKSLLTTKGDPLKSTPKQGDDVIIKLTLRSSTKQHHDDIAIVDLLPGGFEIDVPSVRNRQHWSAEHIDIREDRLVFYGAVGSEPIVITYNARVTTAGEFIVPAAYANAMYDTDTYGHSSSSSILVEPGL